MAAAEVLRRCTAVLVLSLVCYSFGALTSVHNIGQAATASETYPPGDAVDPAGRSIVLWRVTVNNQMDVAKITSGGWDVIEARGPDYLLVLGDSVVGDQLRRAGFHVTADETLYGTSAYVSGVSRTADRTVFDAGYRTVADHEAHLARFGAAYPNLTTVITYGASIQGRALKAVCITNKASAVDSCSLVPTASKPRLMMVAAVHARELSTSEMAYRWMDYLVQGYGTNADVTNILNTSELWVIPVANPDGRLIVESGGLSPLLQRKNAGASGQNGSTGPVSVAILAVAPRPTHLLLPLVARGSPTKG